MLRSAARLHGALEAGPGAQQVSLPVQRHAQLVPRVHVAGVQLAGLLEQLHGICLGLRGDAWVPLWHAALRGGGWRTAGPCRRGGGAACHAQRGQAVQQQRTRAHWQGVLLVLQGRH